MSDLGSFVSDTISQFTGNRCLYEHLIMACQVSLLINSCDVSKACVHACLCVIHNALSPP